MDKNTLIGLLLIFGLFLGFSFYTSSKTKKFQEQQQKAQQEAMAQQVADTTATATLEDVPQAAAADATPAPAPRSNKFSTPDIAQEKDYVVETEKAYYTFAQKGGYIKRVELKDIYRYTPKDSTKLPLVLFDGDDNLMNIKLQCWD